MRYLIFFSFGLLLLGGCRQEVGLLSQSIDDWYFAVGDPDNGLYVSASQLPRADTLVQTPYRINRPNTPLWFITKIKLTEDQLLRVNADDGSQVFYGREQIRQVIPYGYPLSVTTDSVVLAIRVLNNAMAGGLRSARLYPLAAVLDYFQAKEMAQQGGDALPAGYLLDTAFAKSTIQDTLPYRFTAWGDSQGGWETFRQLSEAMATQNTTFSIGLGDLVSDGSSSAQWQGFLEAISPLSKQTSVVPVVGNHDYDGYYDDLIPELYLRHISPQKYFAWSYQNVRFVALDPNETFPLGIRGEQREWLAREMESAAWKNARLRFLLIHQPPYSAGWPGYHGDSFIRELVDELAASARIDFVLSGHSHCYERLTKNYGEQQTHFLILGGAGGGLEPPKHNAYPKMDTIIKAHHYGLFEVTDHQVELKIIGLEGTLLDQFIFQTGH